MKVNNENLFEYIRKGDSDSFFSLFHEDDLNVTEDDGYSLLHVSIARGRTQIIEFLVDRGIDLNKKDKKQGKSALHIAATYQDFQTVNLLISKGANINELDNNFNTPLSDAFISSKKDWDLVKFFIRSGANPFLQNKFGNSVAKMVKESNNELVSFINEVCDEKI